MNLETIVHRLFRRMLYLNLDLLSRDKWRCGCFDNTVAGWDVHRGRSLLHRLHLVVVAIRGWKSSLRALAHQQGSTSDLLWRALHPASRRTIAAVQNLPKVGFLGSIVRTAFSLVVVRYSGGGLVAIGPGLSSPVCGLAVPVGAIVARNKPFSLKRGKLIN